MITVTVIPKFKKDIYILLIKKEKELRQRKKGTLHRVGKKMKGLEKWEHKTYPGSLKFQKCLGGSVVALVQCKNQDKESRLLSSFIGFLDYHFNNEISTIAISYEEKVFSN